MGGCGGVKFKISGGFLHTNYTEGDTHVFIKGKIIELLGHIYPKMNQDYIIKKILDRGFSMKRHWRKFTAMLMNP